MISNQTNLVIVYTATARKSADFLRDLIALQDDTEENTVGVKDGTVKVLTCEDKKFKEENNTSAQKVIYIGKCKRSESTKEHAKWKISQYGLRCGWFGNKAMLYIDKPAYEKKEYEEFYQYALQQAQRLDEVNKKVEISKTQKTVMTISRLAMVVFPPAAVPTLTLSFKELKQRKEIKHQQYDTMVRVFYLDHLKDFIEGRS